mgnify:CR=1 FL=1
MIKFFNKNIDLISVLTGNIMIKGSLFVSWILIARNIGQLEFGVIGLIKSIVLVSTLIFLFGLPNEIIRKFSYQQVEENIEKKLKKNNEIITGILLGYFILILITVFLAFFFYQFLNNLIFENKLTYVNFLLFLLFFLSYSLSIILTSILNGLSQFSWQGFSNVILSFCCIPCLYFLTDSFGINGALFGLIIIYFLQSFSFLFKLFKSNFKFIYNLKVFFDLKELINNSKFIFLHEVFYSISNLIFLVFLMKTLDFSDLGIYNAGDQLTQMILFIPSSVLGYFLNQFILKSKNDAIDFRRKFFIYSILFSLIVGCVVLLFQDLMINFYGIQFHQLKNIFYLFIISITPQILNATYQQNFIADSKSFTLFKITFFNSLFLITGVFVLNYFNIAVLSYFIILRLIAHISQTISFKILS